KLRRRGPDEVDVCVRELHRERRVRAQKAVTGMDGVAAGFARDRNDAVDVEVGTRAAVAERDRTIGASDVQAARVVGRIHRNAFAPVRSGGAKDADRDLAAIGDEQAFYHPALQKPMSSYSTLSSAGEFRWVTPLPNPPR